MEKIKKLHLPGLLQTADMRAEQAVKEQLYYNRRRRLSHERTGTDYFHQTTGTTKKDSSSKTPDTNTSGEKEMGNFLQYFWNLYAALN